MTARRGSRWSSHARRLTRPATKTASGLYERLPLVDWRLVPLVEAGATYAVSAADIARRFEEAGTGLPAATWALLDDRIEQEAQRNAS